MRATAATIAIWAWAAATARRTAVRTANADRGGALFAGGAFAGRSWGDPVAARFGVHSGGVAASITAFFPVLTILIAMRFHTKTTARSSGVIAVAGVIVLFLR